MTAHYTRTPADMARAAAMVARIVAGETLEAVAKDYGITRERVRQIVKGQGIVPSVLSKARTATRRAEARANSLRARVERRAARRAELASQLRFFYLTHGRAPTANETGVGHNPQKHPDAPYANALIKWFGSWREAFRVAGIPSRPVGGRGHMGPRAKRANSVRVDTQVWPMLRDGARRAEIARALGLTYTMIRCSHARYRAMNTTEGAA